MEDEQVARMRILRQHLLGMSGEAVEPLPHVCDPGGDPDLHVRRDWDHTASSALTRLAMADGSSLLVTTSRCPPRVVI